MIENKITIFHSDYETMKEVTLYNAHDILGVEKNVTEAAIKKAFR